VCRAETCGQIDGWRKMKLTDPFCDYATFLKVFVKIILTIKLTSFKWGKYFVLPTFITVKHSA
jgi:hypothetical protein